MISSRLNNRMSSNCKSAFAALVLACSASQAQSAEISFYDLDDGSRRARTIVIEGEIQRGDSLRVKELFSSNVLVRGLDIYSPGGNVAEAIDISRLLNEKLVEVRAVPNSAAYSCSPERDKRIISDPVLKHPRNSQNCVCFSSCALIWLTAPLREPFPGRTGIHRARFPSEEFGELDAVEAEAKYRILLGELEQFLTEHEVPQELIERMRATPSNDIYILSKDDRKLVGERRPFLEELLQAKCAQYSEVSATIASLERRIDRLTEMAADLRRKLYEAERMADLDGALLLLKRDRDLDSQRRNFTSKIFEIGGPYYDCMERSLVSLQSQAQGYKHFPARRLLPVTDPETLLKLDFSEFSDPVVIENSNEIPIPRSKPTKPESPE